VVLAVTAASGSSPSQPCDLVASTAGSDSAPGTLDQPFRTVQKLVDSLPAGDTGCLRGTAAASPFAENVTVANKNSTGAITESDRITVRSYPGEVAKLRGRLVVSDSANRITFSGLVLDGRDAVNAANHLASPQIDGDDVYLLDDNVSAAGGPCVTLGSGTAAMAFRPLVQRVRVHNCTEGVRGQYSRGLQLRESLVYDNTSAGLRLDPDADSSFVRKNILDGNQSNILLGGDSVNYSSSNIITHNIVSNPAAGGWNIRSTWSALNKPPYQLNNIRYTCAFADGRAFGAIDSSSQGFNLRYLIYPPAPGGPMYQDRAAKNFHITSQSPCFTYMNDAAQFVDAGGGPNDEEASAANPKPNVLFIVTDDQNADGTVVPSVMPDTAARIRDAGTQFTDAFGTTPQCCPGRSGIFSGRFNHNNGVINNSATHNLDQNATIQAYLRGGGYRTGLFGKFLNNWSLNDNPPNWDDWSILTAGYCPFIVNERGTRKTYPAGPDQKPSDGDGKCNPADLGRTADAPYSTDYVRDQALSFLDGSETDDDQPWFMELTPTAPHNPFTPEADYANAPVPAFSSDPSTFESDISDKPGWVAQGQKTPQALLGDPNANPPTAGVRANQLRALMSVDDMVQGVLDRLDALGEQDTLIVFTTDNGFMWGDHGLINKGFPYTESAKIPLLMRYAPMTVPGTQDGRFAANIDMAPTAAQAAGINMPTGTFDGVSLLDKGWDRSRALTEYQDSTTADALESPDGLPDWAATRTADHHYIETYEQDGKTIKFREYYDLQNDPYELDNCYGGDGTPGTGDDLCVPAQTVTDLHAQLLADRLCAGTECPPGPGSAATADLQPPRTHLISPSPGGRVCCRVALAANAFDNFGVANVEFRVDGNTVGTDSSAPYEYTWDSTGTPIGPHTISAVATDSSGNSGGGYADSSATVTITASADIQVENGGANPGKPESGDTITYLFSTPVNPGSIQGGWSGVRPNCNANPTARGCVTVSVIGDGFLDELDNDTVIIYSDTAGTLPLSSLGSIDLGDDDYVSYAPNVRSFTASPMELVNGNTGVQITLGTGSVGAAGSGTGTAAWSAPFCGCKVWESVDTADAGPDREF
jgi:arylsulfatase A-like enzyme